MPNIFIKGVKKTHYEVLSHLSGLTEKKGKYTYNKIISALSLALPRTTMHASKTYIFQTLGKCPKFQLTKKYGHINHLEC